MQISFAAQKLPKTGALVVLASEGAKLTAFAAEADKALKGALGRALKASRFSGKAGEMVEVLAPGDSKLSRVLIAGMGKAAELDALKLEELGGRVVARLLASGESAVSIEVGDIAAKAKIDPAAAAAHVGVGARLRSYRFDKYRTKEPAEKKPSLKAVKLLSDAARAAAALYEAQDKVIDGVFLTRDLVSEPANVLYPKSFAAQLKALKDLGVSVTVLGEKEMRKLGMNALLGVAQGSVNEPQLVIMEYNGLPKGSKEKPVAFVGKGVTFDTGGISLKPGPGMEQMKWDMGGAGAVSGAMKALAGRKAKAHVIGVVGLVENMPDGKAQRPGDVVTSMSGQTIEILNTDAEGRLVLCDALWYVQEKHKPRAIIDLATLTGAIIISLGHEYAGMFSNDDTLSSQLQAAGETSGDKTWRMPLGPAYDKMLNTPTADMKNIGGRDAGSITAAQFLQRFIKNGTPWAHIDIAGTVWVESDAALWEKGATGYGVRLLDHLIADHYEVK